MAGHEDTIVSRVPFAASREDAVRGVDRGARWRGIGAHPLVLPCLAVRALDREEIADTYDIDEYRMLMFWQDCHV